MTPTLPFAMMNVFFIFIVPVASPLVTEVTEEGSTNVKVLVSEFIEILDSTVNSVDDRSGVTE
jgi:hypothetical protein